MNIAVIPARGGSKRIPRKNIRRFSGKPIIVWSIEAAKKSNLFDKIIVSTDDAEIAEIAIENGAECPFVRPQDLSDDYATTAAVVAHATKWLIDQSISVSAVCCIYPTAPLLQVEDLKIAKSLLNTEKWEYVFSATQFDPQVLRSFKCGIDGHIEMLFPDYFNTRTQDLPAILHDAGQFYWGKTDAWLRQKKIFDKYSTCVEIPNWRVRDIDTENDWVEAEKIFKLIREQENEYRK